jgi:hypothetical protein
VYVLLRRMVDNVAGADDVKTLRRYPTLRREIVTAAYRSLERFKVPLLLSCFVVVLPVCLSPAAGVRLPRAQALSSSFLPRRTTRGAW